MKRALLVPLAIVIALPVAGLAAAHAYLGEDALRTRIEAAVEKATGRTLSIAGPIGLSWSLTLTIDATDLSLANPPGFSRPAMAHVDRIQAKVALLPLLSRRVEVTGLTITGPDVLLERDAQGRPNWDFTRPATVPTQAAPAVEPGAKMTLDVGEVAIRNAALAVPGLTFAAPAMTYDPASGRIAGEVSLRGATLHITGFAAPNRPLDLHLEGAGFKLAIAGGPASTTLTGEAADLSSLSGLAGAKLPPLRDVRVATRATLAPGSLTLDGLQATSAQADLAGALTLTTAPRPFLRGVLHSTRLDLDALTMAPAPTPLPAIPSPPVPPPPTGKLIPDTPIPYAALRSGDADLALDAASLAWRGKTYTNVVAHLTLQDGKLGLDPVSMALGEKTLSAHIRADAAAQTLAATIDAPGLPAGPVIALLGGPANAAGVLDLRADLRGQGPTWRAVAASLQGQAGLAMVDGEIDNAWLLDKLQDAFRAANLPISAGGDSKVRCAAISADVEAGAVRLQAMTLDTSKLKLEGGGSLDLGAETLDLHLRPTLRIGAAVSVPVHVAGSWRTPKIVLDAGAITPGRVGISIGGPPPPDTCGPALDAARGGKPGPAPSAAAAAANRPLKPADLLRGLLR